VKLVSSRWIELLLIGALLLTSGFGSGVDFSHYEVTSPVAVGGQLPGNCVKVGQLFFLTTAPKGQNLFGCTPDGQWTSMSGGGATGQSGSTSQTSTTTGVANTTSGLSTSGSSSTSVSTTSASVSFLSSQNSVSVGPGQSVTITADRPVSWMLAQGSQGSISNATSTSITYTAPPVIGAQNTYAGCVVSPNDSIYNTPISSLPVHSSSGQWIAQTLSIAAAGISITPSWGINIVDNSLPATTMSFRYTTLQNGSQYQLPSGNVRYRENGSLTSNGDRDHHLIAINRQSCHIFETYQDTATSGPVSTAYAASGWQYDGSGYSQPSSSDGGGATDASGLPLLPLTLHLADVEGGKITHALRFTSCAGCISSGFLWPAVGSTGGATQAAPMGSRWRLKSSFNISSFSPAAQVILQGLMDYGMLLSDVGTIGQIEADADVNGDPVVAAALQEIASAKITASSFDVVDESGLMIVGTSNRLKPNNGLVIAQSSASLIATDSTGNTIFVPLELQPLTVGTPFPVLNIQAGSVIPLLAWVNGSSNQALNWAVMNGPGSVDQNGLYSAPANVSAPTNFVVAATAQADGVTTATIRGQIIPAGTIQIDVGSPAPYTDSSGGLWLADTLGLDMPAFANNDSSYPPSLWSGIPDWKLYATRKYTWGDDINYVFGVPNGVYRVQFLFARTDCVGTYDPSAVDSSYLTAGGVVGLEAQGELSMFNIATATNSSCRTPAIGELQTSVSDGILRVALRSTSTSNSQESPSLNGLRIIPQ
jgi:hypothetical protein